MPPDTLILPSMELRATARTTAPLVTRTVSYTLVRHAVRACLVDSASSHDVTRGYGVRQHLSLNSQPV